MISSTMLLGNAIDDGEEVDAEDLARAETYSYTTRGRLSGALAGQL